nr:RNA-directed DNA polymerase, eukaryota, reverse transcriptase zinc-binding domain protein [Tanacetum cinerariifolium]
MDYFHQTEAELGIDLNKPLSEQDPLDKMNDIAKIHDYFRANKRLNSSVQYEDHPAGTVLNEPVLGMIMFNSYHRHNFVIIEDLGYFLNEMLYTVQEIFFRLHQGPGLDDHARTFSSFLLAEVDKRNLNPLKQMRTINPLLPILNGAVGLLECDIRLPADMLWETTSEEQEKSKMVASAFGEDQGGSSALRPIGLFFLIASVGSHHLYVITISPLAHKETNYQIAVAVTNKPNHGIRNGKEDGGSMEKQSGDKNAGCTDTYESMCYGHFKKSGASRTGGSIVQIMDELVTVGQTMGYDMTELCVSNKVNFVSLQETKMESIDLWGIKRCWGNFDFDYVYSEAVGNSCGILCVWDPNMFKKLNATVSDFFTIVRGIWLPSGKRLLVISVYARQELRDKKMLWDYLVMVICNWDGEVVAIGDFNEVRDCSERFGSVFNKKGAEVFNNFIATAGLVEVPLGGYSWNEANICDQNDFINLMKKLRFLKEKIRKWNCVYKESKKCGTRNLKVELNSLDSVIDKGDSTNLVKDALVSDITNDEVRKAVRDCGVDKTPGPDGFTFGFYRRYWKLIKMDVIKAVKWFFLHGSIPNGGNASFITLIPKIPNANMVKDFMPISLIGSIYKIVEKILANRLVTVLGDLVNEIQSAFVADRQILDGPFILNEIVQWCKKMNKHAMVFKVDFEKAYDSVRWDFVEDILSKFGFGDKWCTWIRSCLQSSRGSVIVNGSPTEEFQFYKGLKQVASMHDVVTKVMTKPRRM